MREYFTVKEVAEQYGLKIHVVLGWIKNGELAAINVGHSYKCKKPRYRIKASALQEFEHLRSTLPERRQVTTRRQIPKATKNYF